MIVDLLTETNPIVSGTVQKKRMTHIRFESYKEIFSFSPSKEVRALTTIGNDNVTKYMTPGRPSSQDWDTSTEASSRDGWDAGFKWSIPAEGMKGEGERLKFMDTLVNSGWEKGARRCRELSNKILSANPSVATINYESQKYSGQRLNVNAYLNGRANCFSKLRIEQMTGPKRILLIANVGVNANENQEQMFIRAAPFLAAADYLENSGYSVSIEALAIADGYYDGNMMSSITVKEYQDPLNMSKAAAILCSAAVFRNGMFHAWAAGQVRVGGGFGHMTQNPEQIVNLQAFVGCAQERVVSLNNLGCVDVKGAIAATGQIIKLATDPD